MHLIPNWLWTAIVLAFAAFAVASVVLPLFVR